MPSPRAIVGADFNPSGMEAVDRLKELAAEMIEIVQKHCSYDPFYQEYRRNPAINAIQEASMWAVRSVVTSQREDGGT